MDQGSGPDSLPVADGTANQGDDNVTTTVQDRPDGGNIDAEMDVQSKETEANSTTQEQQDANDVSTTTADQVTENGPNATPGKPRETSPNVSPTETEQRNENTGPSVQTSKFWKRALELRPQLTGAVVYFCPARTGLQMRINEDGTVSPLGALDKRFNSAVRLADVLISGRIKLPKLFRMPRNVSASFYSFSQDFFFEPGREKRIKDSFPPAIARELFGIENLQERMQELTPVDGIDLDEPIVLDIAETPVDISQKVTVVVNASVSSAPTEIPSTENTAPPVLVADTGTPNTSISQPSENVADSTQDALDADDGFDLTDFWKIAIQVRPDLIGRTVYFAPTKKTNLACVVNNDATFSPLCDRSKRYTEASDLAADVHKRRLRVNDFDLQKNSAAYTCITDFFMDPYRHYSVLAGLGRFGRCAGVNRSKYIVVIQDHHWETTRKECAPFVVHANTLRSKTCTNLSIGGRLRCDLCDKLRDQLAGMLSRSRSRPPGSTFEKRMLHTSEKYMTPEDKKRKYETMVKDHKNTIETLRRKIIKLEKMELEMNKYKPVHAVNQEVIRNLVEYLNEETTKNTSPKCYWTEMEEGGICGFTTDSIVNMCAHVNSIHYRSQVEANSNVDEETQKFYCYWRGCTHRRRPLPTSHQLHLHLFEHTGSRSSVQKLDVLRCQLFNLNRKRSARRYNDAMIQSLLNGGEQQSASWRTIRANSVLPLPSSRISRRRSVKKEKNRCNKSFDTIFDVVLQNVMGADSNDGADESSSGSGAAQENGDGESSGGSSSIGQSNEDESRVISSNTTTTGPGRTELHIGGYSRGVPARAIADDIFEEDPDDDELDEEDSDIILLDDDVM